MKDLEHASALLTVVRKELTALRAMRDPAVFADEIFGFHAQQATEKCLKAWIAALGGEYPFRHDLGELFGVLERLGQDIERFWWLVEFTDFGVRLRYETLDEDEPPLDRNATCELVGALLAQVESVIARESTSA